MVLMTKKRTAAESNDSGGKSKKINFSIDLRILATIERYRDEQKEKVRFRPTMRDVIELALLSFFEAEGTELVKADELDDE